MVNKNRTYPITAGDVTFNIISMSIGTKEKLVYDIQHIGHEDGAFERLLGVICPVIVSIDEYEGDTHTVLSKLEFLEDLRAIVQAVLAHCALSPDEAKNSPSSSEQLIPASARNAESNATPENEPASTTSTATGA